MNTIGDMQNGMYFYGHCNEFVYNLDFEKIDDVLLEYVYIIYLLNSL